MTKCLEYQISEQVQLEFSEFTMLFLAFAQFWKLNSHLSYMTWLIVNTSVKLSNLDSVENAFQKPAVS